MRLVILVVALVLFGVFADANQRVHDHSHHDHGHGHSHHDHEHDHSHHDHDHGHSHHEHDHDENEHKQGHSHIGHNEDFSQPMQSISFFSKFSKESPKAAAIIATVIISSSSLVVMPLLPFVDGSARSKRMMKLLVSAAVGGLLGDVFLHILPHAVNPHDHSSHGHHHHHENKPHNHLQEALVIGLPVLAGILVFFVAEKLVSNLTGSGSSGKGHSHGSTKKEEPVRKSSSRSNTSPPTSPRAKSPTRASKSKSTETPKSAFAAVKAAGWLNLVADMMHNFTDGLAIGVAFRTGNGASTTVAVFFHEVPHNVADFGILLQNGFSKRAALAAQFVSALGSLVGCIVGLSLEKVIGLDLFVGGGFIYIATVGVIPDLLDDTNVWHTLQEAVAMSFGVAMMALMLTFE